MKEFSTAATTMTTPRRTTLLDLIEAVSIYATPDAEVAATVAYLINSGTVEFCSSFTRATIDLAVLLTVTRFSTASPLGPGASRTGPVLIGDLLSLESRIITERRQNGWPLTYSRAGKKQ
jgi:hypothetical protein